jgi:hypothetical protein
MTTLNYRLFVIAGALAVLAACGGPSSEAPTAPTEVGAQAPTDPAPKFVGAPTTEFQTAGDAIAGGTVIRDVTFAVDGSQNMEIVVVAAQSPMRAHFLNNEGNIVAEADVAANAEVTLTGIATDGDQNRVRVTRESPDGDIAPFEVRFRIAS